MTSNPSPAYVYRAAKAFDDNGSGVRGDLGAVVRAILTDFEARSPEVAAITGYGKMREPLLRMTNLYRIAPATANDGRLDPRNFGRDFGQQAVNAPSVFNFFEPDYVRPGALAAAGLYAPEFQVLTDTTAITGSNVIYTQLFGNSGGVSANVASLVSMAGQRDVLIDYLNLMLTANSLSETSLEYLRAAYDRLSSGTSPTIRVRNMVYLTMLSPEAVVQR